MVRLILLLALALLAWRVITGRWPWEPRALPPRSADRERARVLLGVHPGATREDIIEAHKKLLAMVHPDRGGSNEAVHEANHARAVLLADAAPRNTEHP